MRNHSTLSVAAAVLLLLFATSLTLYLVEGNKWQRRVLFFPSVNSGRLEGEVRYLPRKHTLEERVELLVEEAILGPIGPFHDRLLPRGVRVVSVVVRSGKGYVDLSSELVLGERGTVRDWQRSIQGLANIVLFNFPRIHRLFVLVDGQLPGSGYEDGLRFRPALLR